MELVVGKHILLTGMSTNDDILFCALRCLQVKMFGHVEGFYEGVALGDGISEGYSIRMD